MASTVEGRALTEANRIKQLAVAARAVAVSRALWEQLDPFDIDRSVERWMPAQLATFQRFHAESQALTASYLSEYRMAEIGDDAGPVVAPKFPLAEMRNAALLAGPVRVKLLVGRGETPGSAHAKAFTKFSGIARRQVMSGGRMMIDATTGSDTRAVGWRRVTDGNPCTFCAMLAGRGPIYQERTTQGDVMRPLRGGGEGLRYHGHCGCTAEIVYGEWTPNEAERGYIEDYEKAAREAEADGQQRTQDTVLWRMRQNSVYRDSPLSRNK